jgi:periplasmic protein TonB
MDPERMTDTANDRFKRGAGDWVWYSVAVAAMFHLVLFAFWPDLTAADMRTGRDELETIDLPPEIEIPPPPEQLARPAMPIIGSADIDDDITIPPSTFEFHTPERLAAPPGVGTDNDDLDRAPRFVPMQVRPQLKNMRDIERSLERNYPAILRDAGVGGTPILWFLIDEDGRVLQTRLHTSSGYPALDEAAQKVAPQMLFSPAINQGRPIKVWVEIPVNFTSR